VLAAGTALVVRGHTAPADAEPTEGFLMPSSPRTLARAGVVGALTCVVATMALPAEGAVRNEETLCDYTVGDSGGRGHGGASFDSAIGDDVVIRVGESVSLDPVTGTVGPPDQFAPMLQEAGVTTVQGSGTMTLRVAETGDEYHVVLAFASHQVTDLMGGGSGLRLTGVGGEVTPDVAGTHTLMVRAFALSFDAGEGGPDIEMTCELFDGPAAVDAFTATAAGTSGEDPVRPDVVQTDFAEDEGAPVRPFVLVGLLAAGVAALVVSARTVSRRR
jgi:hypothetical protein